MCVCVCVCVCEREYVHARAASTTCLSGDFNFITAARRTQYRVGFPGTGLAIRENCSVVTCIGIEFRGVGGAVSFAVVGRVDFVDKLVLVLAAKWKANLELLPIQRCNGNVGFGFSYCVAYNLRCNRRPPAFQRPQKRLFANHYQGPTRQTHEFDRGRGKGIILEKVK